MSAQPSRYGQRREAGARRQRPSRTAAIAAGTCQWSASSAAAASATSTASAAAGLTRLEPFVAVLRQLRILEQPLRVLEGDLEDDRRAGRAVGRSELGAEASAGLPRSRGGSTSGAAGTSTSSTDRAPTTWASPRAVPRMSSFSKRTDRRPHASRRSRGGTARGTRRRRRARACRRRSTSGSPTTARRRAAAGTRRRRDRPRCRSRSRTSPASRRRRRTTPSIDCTKRPP